MASFLMVKSRSFVDAMEISMTNILQSVSEDTTHLDMCRICNQGNADIPIFDDTSHINISEEVMHITGVFMHKVDKYSKYICENCFNLLKGSIFFRELCLRNNQNCLKKLSNREEHIMKTDGEQVFEQEIPPNRCDDEVDTWLCSSCNKEFLDMISYDIHCTECNKNNENAELNFKVEKNERALCEVCGKTIACVGQLTLHLKSHSNNFPYLCDNCPYRGRTVELLKVHKRIHLKVKPFKCTQCPQRTTTHGNLRKHMDRRHSNIQYKCPYCEKITSSKHDLTKHIEDMHLNQEPFPCDICCKTFKIRHYLRKHLRKVHKIKTGHPRGRIPDYLRYQNEEGNKDKINADVI
ncbi:zinc finger protein 501-like isoform X1 [Pieris brassicae]|nr:zinc finger protein 501-like isoform X1 [Pieris brassicae]